MTYARSRIPLDAPCAEDMGRTFRKLPGAGGGLQTRTGAVVSAFETFSKMRQLEPDPHEHEQERSLVVSRTSSPA